MAEKILSGVPETMLQTLYARARETQTGRNYINDPRAVEIVSSLDYDFRNAEQDRAMRSGVVARTILLDRMVRAFLKDHPGTTVINLACGLDTRCYRMEGDYKAWYNLDLPETMAIRSRFFTPAGQIHQIASSAAEEAWISQIFYKDGPVLVIIEGLTMYLRQEEVQQIFGILHKAFPEITVFAEVMNPFVVSHMKEKSIEGSKAKFTWGIRSGKELEALIPPFQSVEDHSLTEGMAVFLPIYRFLGRIGPIRNISNKILVLKK